MNIFKLNVLDLNMHNTIYVENYLDLQPHHRCDCLNETRVITVCHDMWYHSGRERKVRGCESEKVQTGGLDTALSCCSCCQSTNAFLCGSSLLHNNHKYVFNFIKISNNLLNTLKIQKLLAKQRLNSIFKITKGTIYQRKKIQKL